MSGELLKLIEPELQEVNKILKMTCKIGFETEGKLPLTGFKIKATISIDNPSLSWNTTVSVFNLTQFPGNCAIMITHETYQSYDYRKKGLSVPIHKMKEKIARHFGYSILLATTITTNLNDNVLEKAGFKKVEPLCFLSSRTFKRITTWMKELT